MIIKNEGWKFNITFQMRKKKLRKNTTSISLSLFFLFFLLFFFSLTLDASLFSKKSTPFSSLFQPKMPTQQPLLSLKLLTPLMEIALPFIG